MASINRTAHAKAAVINEWDSWSKSHPDDAKRPMAGMRFFTYLQIEKAELLDFPTRTADKWQPIYEWLLRESRVKS